MSELQRVQTEVILAVRSSGGTMWGNVGVAAAPPKPLPCLSCLSCTP